MRFAIVYASTEGQTRKIARFAAHRLTDAGHSVELLPADDADDLDLARVDGAILAGSVHAGQYQAALRDFAASRKAALVKLPTLFVSVSLSAAGEDPEEWEALAECVRRFQDETGWKPGEIAHVAGAFRFTEYNFFTYWAMRWIAAQKDETVKRGDDREYTDWTALGTTLDNWVSEAFRG